MCTASPQFDMDALAGTVSAVGSAAFASPPSPQRKNVLVLSAHRMPSSSQKPPPVAAAARVAKHKRKVPKEQHQKRKKQLTTGETVEPVRAAAAAASPPLAPPAAVGAAPPTDLVASPVPWSPKETVAALTTDKPPFEEVVRGVNPSLARLFESHLSNRLLPTLVLTGQLGAHALHKASKVKAQGSGIHIRTEFTAPVDVTDVFSMALDVMMLQPKESVAHTVFAADEKWHLERSTDGLFVAKGDAAAVVKLDVYVVLDMEDVAAAGDPLWELLWQNLLALTPLERMETSQMFVGCYKTLRRNATTQTRAMPNAYVFVGAQDRARLPTIATIRKEYVFSIVPVGTTFVEPTVDVVVVSFDPKVFVHDALALVPTVPCLTLLGRPMVPPTIDTTKATFAVDDTNVFDLLQTCADGWLGASDEFGIPDGADPNTFALEKKAKSSIDARVAHKIVEPAFRAALSVQIQKTPPKDLCLRQAILFAIANTEELHKVSMFLPPSVLGGLAMLPESMNPYLALRGTTVVWGGRGDPPMRHFKEVCHLVLLCRASAFMAVSVLKKKYGFELKCTTEVHLVMCDTPDGDPPVRVAVEFLAESTVHITTTVVASKLLPKPLAVGATAPLTHELLHVLMEEKQASGVFGTRTQATSSMVHTLPVMTARVVHQETKRAVQASMCTLLPDVSSLELQDALTNGMVIHDRMAEDLAVVMRLLMRPLSTADIRAYSKSSFGDTWRESYLGDMDRRLALVAVPNTELRSMRNANVTLCLQ